MSFKPGTAPNSNPSRGDIYLKVKCRVNAKKIAAEVCKPGEPESMSMHNPIPAAMNRTKVFFVSTGRQMMNSTYKKALIEPKKSMRFKMSTCRSK